MPAYVPILATDASRLEGFAATPDAVRARLTPLFDVTAPPRGRRLEAHLDAIADALSAALAPARGAADAVARVALVDARDAGAERGGDCARAVDGRVHLAYLLDAARARGLALVPVTGLRRPDAYQLAVADAASVDRRGVALRLERPDFRDPGALPARALALLDALGVPPEQADLVLDFGGVTAGHLAAYEATARAVVAALARDVRWRTVTVAAATQLPADGRGAVRGPRAVPRTDWLLWRALTGAAGATPAPGLEPYAREGALRFGDYGPLLYGPHPVRPDGAAEWVGYAHGAEWVVRDDVVGEGPRGAPLADAPRADAGRPGGWRGEERRGEERRGALRVLREPGVGRSDPYGPAWPEPPPAWPHAAGDEPAPPHAPPPVAPPADLAAAERSAAERATERATWRAAVVTHHLTVAAEQLAPSPRPAEGR